jgi:hypothetical protein
MKNTLRKFLKILPPIRFLNAKLKGEMKRRLYKNLNNYYKEIASQRDVQYYEENINIQLKEILIKRKVYPKPVSKGELRIFWVGADYDQDSAGIIQELEKFGEVILFRNILGKFELLNPVDWHKMIARKQNSYQLLNQIKKSLESGPIHCIIGQMRAEKVNVNILQELRELGLIIVNISMDDRHAFLGKKLNSSWSGIKGLINSIDLGCTTAPECCLWYQIEGCPSYYLPEASSPDVFKPLQVPKSYDVSFVGSNYGIRGKIVKVLIRDGIKVEVYGRNWPNGRIATRDIPELFARSRIVLGVGAIGYTKDFCALKMRDFDGPMSGSFYITQYNSDLEGLYKIGKEIETYSNIPEGIEKVKYYLDHPEVRERIAKAGHRRALQDHTWEKRFERVFRTIGILKEGILIKRAKIH